MCDFWLRTYRKWIIWIMRWIVEKERLAAVLEYSKGLPCRLCLLCAVQLLTICCVYYSLFICLCRLGHSQSQSLHEWVMDETFLISWISLVWHLYLSTSFLLWETFTCVILHLHSSFTLPVSLSQALPNTVHSQVPHRGRQQAGMPIASPCPLRATDVTTHLPGDSVRHINTFIHRCGCPR